MTHSVLIIDDDAEAFAAPIGDVAGLRVAVARDESEARAAYDGQSILFGSPLAIAGVLGEMPEVRWVQSTWAGVTPLLGLSRRDYVLTGVKDVFGPQMAEYVLGHLLALELKVQERAAAQLARQWLPEASGTLNGKRMGIMGTGSIGAAIARQAATFGMQVTGLSRSGAAVDGFGAVFAMDRIAEFLQPLDYLVAVLPDTPATDGLLNAHTLELLPANAMFVNVGRANVVDDNALVEALKAGRLRAAVLDVFDEEPIPEDSAFWTAPNLTITAHIAAISHPHLIVPIFLDNFRRFAAGLDLLHRVDFDLGY